jgi:hypothetical protein
MEQEQHVLEALRYHYMVKRVMKTRLRNTNSKNTSPVLTMLASRSTLLQ